jgi:hypothetical protein
MRGKKAMSIFASILRAVYRLSGVKKSFTLPENELRKEIEKQNRHRGVFTPTDHKAYYEMDVAPYENSKPIYYEFTAWTAAYASMELLHAKLVRTTTCVDGCRCDYTICGDKDPYVKELPEYWDENGYRRNK